MTTVSLPARHAAPLPAPHPPLWLALALLGLHVWAMLGLIRSEVPSIDAMVIAAVSGSALTLLAALELYLTSREYRAATARLGAWQVTP